MAAEVIETTFAERFVDRWFDELIGQIGNDAGAQRIFAEAMVAKGGGLLMALDGRAESARILRGLADNIENPEPAGTA